MLTKAITLFILPISSPQNLKSSASEDQTVYSEIPATTLEQRLAQSSSTNGLQCHWSFDDDVYCGWVAND